MPYADRAKQRAFQLRWITNRRNQAIQERDGVCELCGAADSLEFHHFDQATKFTHRFWSWRWSRIQAELAKCWLLCGACHLELSRSQAREKATQRFRINGRFAIGPLDTVNAV
jgi:hypothetical protein